MAGKTYDWPYLAGQLKTHHIGRVDRLRTYVIALFKDYLCGVLLPRDALGRMTEERLRQNLHLELDAALANAYKTGYDEGSRKTKEEA
jgi:hypothetical protein